jgi:hypothetical protein
MPTCVKYLLDNVEHASVNVIKEACRLLAGLTHVLKREDLQLPPSCPSQILRLPDKKTLEINENYASIMSPGYVDSYYYNHIKDYEVISSKLRHWLGNGSGTSNSRPGRPLALLSARG